MNYFRPHDFGLEAEPEVRFFINRFEPQVQDPQKDGMGNGPYSTKGLLTTSCAHIESPWRQLGPGVVGTNHT
ncbi:MULTISPECIES: hypothetical protein [Paraburkholderia]|uniref:hypothetical protein n=1 Tax=Paraburkholderia TaxID=1822464 RepID=UPI0038B91CBE